MRQRRSMLRNRWNAYRHILVLYERCEIVGNVKVIYYASTLSKAVVLAGRTEEVFVDKRSHEATRATLPRHQI